jgi:hypothetical protein
LFQRTVVSQQHMTLMAHSNPRPYFCNNNKVRLFAEVLKCYNIDERHAKRLA